MSNRTITGLLLILMTTIGGIALVCPPLQDLDVNHSEAASAPPKPRFDVSDVSILWPIPVNAEDVKGLISADDVLADGGPVAWPMAAFQSVLAAARSDVASIKFASGVKRVGLKPGFESRSNWKVAGIRVDPSAPGGSDDIVAKFGETPQIRVIVQPVTVSDDGKVTVHDFAAHLVYSFTTGFDPADPNFLPRALPDRDKFRAILDDLARLKSSLKAAGIDTQGMPLGVHPGLKTSATAKDVTAQLKAFLGKHLSDTKLGAMAFLGTPDDAPEPWIFGALTSDPSSGKYVPAASSNLGGASSQGLNVLGGAGGEVVPTPLPTNLNPITNNLAIPLAERRGVATAALFGKLDQATLDAPAVIGVDADGKPVVDHEGSPKNRDIADVIANPLRTHFFSGDCISCHTESRRRKVLLLPVSPLGYTRPDGVSGVDPGVLPASNYNVRNFGWFQAASGGPTITMRAANETANVVDFINRVYFGNEK